MQRDSDLAIDVISYLGNYAPTKKQIEIMGKILVHSGLFMQLYFDTKLTKRERECLQLARLGC